MLLELSEYDRIDPRRLMEIYREGNEENAAYLYPDMDRAAAVALVERDFLSMLERDFFTKPGNRCFVWTEDGQWVSALRIYFLQDGLYYLEALETCPDHRRKGCGAALLRAVLEKLRERGAFRLCDCVSKRNVPSIALHRACGFTVLDPGFDYLQNTAEPRCYGMEYVWSGTP